MDVAPGNFLLPIIVSHCLAEKAVTIGSAQRLKRIGVESVAADPWFEGVSAIDRKLRTLLESEGVTAVDAAPGTAFDPREHEAIANVPGTDRPDGEIVDEVRRGYRLRDRVIRPALVAVATNSDTGTTAGNTSDTPVH